MSDKYILVTISGIHTNIAKPTDTEGYTIGVLETFLPTTEELKRMTDKDQLKWTVDNNKRMKAICKFLNRNNL